MYYKYLPLNTFLLLKDYQTVHTIFAKLATAI
jgi:hypothetical protein